ncbi:hypothetical protein GCM10009798_13100 [Nocardioides panacihumi]|uniref:ABC transporter ATP-binding protein n=1 Tax=Nocardioides panacihumi TaxID=400774 RepID=A0ABP5C161_9ACTN
MKSTAKTSVQRLSNGTYRVGSARGRSAITGRFITKAAEKPARVTAEAPKQK